MTLLERAPRGEPQPSRPAKLRLGGMALRNGLIVHGPHHWTAAVRSAEGGIEVFSGPKPRIRARVSELPGLRGIARLGEALALLPVIKRRVPDIQLPFEDTNVALALVSSSAIAAGVRRLGPRTLARETAVALLGVAPTALALRDSELASYHAVEHKSIAGYEQDIDAAAAAKEHDRCGSNLVAPMLISTVLGNALARSLFDARGPVANAAATLGGAALAVELLVWSERHRGTPLARAIKRPGMEMQRLFATREPSDEQLEVGRAALAEILRVEGAAAAPPEVGETT